MKKCKVCSKEAAKGMSVGRISCKPPSAFCADHRVLNMLGWRALSRLYKDLGVAK